MFPKKAEDWWSCSSRVKDWVIPLPDARLAPVGCWSTLCVCDSKRLLKCRRRCCRRSTLRARERATAYAAPRRAGSSASASLGAIL